ncbi:glycosyltransferase family 2 protein [Butyrivibrio fibrisolvens]|uniref:glycosyltransferase family 2 protein n=1 Tax=Butyrivibrio fibrisolvens TaxID=831 RepID=UPI0020C051A5|nr:glycosyltransferase family 2 protein [Butyrivibrio fibrisolvens]
MKDLIQVIIPIYKAQEFLYRCLISIKNQTYTNFIVYLINDASPDNSLEICRKISQEDARFKVISLLKNSGPAHARNVGLEHADLKQGYIAFIDADDYIEPRYFEHLVNLLKDSDADFSWVSVNNTFEKEKLVFPEIDCDKEKIFSITGHDLLLREDLRIMYLMVWGKLFKSSLWKDVRFNEAYHYFEDGATTFKVIYKAGKVIVSDLKLYNYYYSENSVTRSGINTTKLIDGLNTEIDKIDFYKEKNEKDLMDMAYIAYLNTILGILRQTDKRQYKNLRSKVWKLYRQSYKNVFDNKNISNTQKLKYCLYRINPDIQKLYLKLKLG